MDRISPTQKKTKTVLVPQKYKDTYLGRSSVRHNNEGKKKTVKQRLKDSGLFKDKLLNMWLLLHG